MKPGGWIPVDGWVIGGKSFVDQSMITGESLPSEKVAGTRVYAGSIIQSGTLEVKAGGIGPDWAFGRILEPVERAERSRSPIQKTTDHLAGNLDYLALACAIATFAATRNMSST